MKHLAATLIALVMAVTAVDAQNTSTTPGPGPESTTLEIKNSAQIAIVFDISCDQGSNWDAMTLAAGTNETYFCKSATIPASLWFRLITQVPGQPRRELRGPLAWKSRHEIVWDQGLEMWFIRLVNSP
jgi:hypothetical protein